MFSEGYKRIGNLWTSLLLSADTQPCVGNDGLTDESIQIAKTYQAAG